MSLISNLLEKPAELSAASKFSVLCGLLYMAFGVQMMVWPAAVQVLFLDPQFTGHEAALLRLLGMTMAILGLFYWAGGRSGARQLVAASVLERVILVPLVLVPLALSGVFPHLLWTFAMLDPVLALVAWRLLAKG